MRTTQPKHIQITNRRPWTCPCGKTVHGNGGKGNHRKACPVWNGKEGAR